MAKEPYPMYTKGQFGAQQGREKIFLLWKGQEWNFNRSLHDKSKRN